MANEPNLTASDLGLTKLSSWMDSNFWTRKEGKVAKAVLVGIALAVATGVVISAPAILTYILVVIQTITSIALHVGGLVTSYILLTNKRIRTLAGSMFRAGIRKLTSIFVDMAPVAVARDIIATSWKNIEKAKEAINKFKVQMGLFVKEIANFSEKLEEQEAGAKLYLKRGERERAELMQSAAEKTRQRRDSLQIMSQKMEVVCRTLEQMYGKANIRLKNAEDELEDQIRTRQMLMDGQRAIGNLKAAIMGSSSQNEMFDMAVTKIALDVANAAVEIDDFVTMGAELFESVDLEEAKFGERAIRQIEKWEQDSRSSVLGPGEKRALIDASHNPSQPYDLGHVSAQANQTIPNQKFDPNDFFTR